MGLPVFRFTLSHPSIGTREISEPEGWKEVQMKLDRHPDFHSLIEYFDGSFTFYGQCADIDGGVNFIRQVESTYGLNAKITISIAATFDSMNYVTIFSGLIDIRTIKELPDNKIEAPIVRNDLWSKLVSRLEIPVDLRSTTDLDGNPVAPVEPIDLLLVPQRIRQQFRRSTNYNDNNEGLFLVASNVIVGSRAYLIFGNSYKEVDEISERFEYGTQISDVNPIDELKYLFKCEYSGNYQISTSIYYSLVTNAVQNIDVRWYIAYSGGGGSLVTTQIGTTDSGSGVLDIIGGPKSYSNNLSLNAGDVIYIYAEVDLSAGNSTMTYFSDFDLSPTVFQPVYTSLEIVSDNFRDDTPRIEAFLLHDCFAGVIQRYCGTNSFYSEILGSTFTTMRTYLENGCHSGYAITKGLHIRGYDMDSKIFSVSFMDLWNGANPILNLGFGYEEIGGQELLRMESKGHYYDASSPEGYINNVRNISREYDESNIFSLVEIGYNKWESEGSSGLDDPQSKRKFATILY